ncbi:MAG: trimethylamine methyltransferase family protein, partial [Anaerolineales bacterium]
MPISQLAQLLTPQQITRVHEASLHILSEVGMLVRNEDARDVFARHGCQVNAETHFVTFPSQIVEHFREAFPPTFTFYARDPQYDVTLPDDRPVILTGSSAPNVIDPVSGNERRARSDDIARIAHLINELPGYDVFSVSTLADDAPEGHFSLARYYPALKNCAKPVRGNMPTVEQALQVVRVGEIIAGGAEAYRARPFVTHHCCPCVSPLTMDWDSTALLLAMCRENLPIYASIVPN